MPHLEKCNGFLWPRRGRIYQSHVYSTHALQVCLSNKAILSFFDRKKTKINFVNIRDKSYNPSQHGGVLYEDAMRHLHVVDGTQVSLSSPLPLARALPVGTLWLSLAPAAYASGHDGFGGCAHRV